MADVVFMNPAKVLAGLTNVAVPATGKQFPHFFKDIFYAY
jgi:hypothetical protein